MRLQSFLSRAGIASRRGILEELEAGKVKVNGEVVRIPSYPIFPDQDQVTFEGQEVKLSGKKLYFAFHKPRGVISTAKDTHGRKTVLDFFKHVPERLYPVGRLDQDTTGFLLLTNDGDLAHRLSHPSFGVEKVYEALVDKEVSKEELEKLQAGVEIQVEDEADDESDKTSGDEKQVSDEGSQGLVKTAPCRMRLLSARDGKSKVEITLHEGKKRQIRLMFQTLGIRVTHLHRKRFGPLNLKGLTPGKSRPLDDREIDMLMAGRPSAPPSSRFDHRRGSRNRGPRRRFQRPNRQGAEGERKKDV